MKLLRLLFVSLGLLAVARADVTLAPLFQDHAVLQRDQPLPDQFQIRRANDHFEFFKHIVSSTKSKESIQSILSITAAFP